MRRHEITHDAVDDKALLVIELFKGKPSIFLSTQMRRVLVIYIHRAISEKWVGWSSSKVAYRKVYWQPFIT